MADENQGQNRDANKEGVFDGLWKLLRPLEEADVLVRREIPFYAQRRHWMIAAPEILESLSVFLLTFLLTFLNRVPSGAIGGLAFIMALAGVIAMARNKKSRPSLAGLAVTVVVGYVLLGPAGAGLFGMLWSLGRSFAEFLEWRFYERLYITDRRVIGSSGILQSKIDTLPLSRATDISYEKPFLGELLGYATLRIETAGQDQALGTIHFIKNPEVFYELLILQSVGTADVA